MARPRRGRKDHLAVQSNDKDDDDELAQVLIGSKFPDPNRNSNLNDANVAIGKETVYLTRNNAVVRDRSRSNHNT